MQPPTVAEPLPPASLPVLAQNPYYTPTSESSGDAPLVTMGDITVTRNSVIVPQGRFPLRGTTWTVQDSIQVTESIPAWAIVMTILFVWLCLLGLLFLLAKERRYAGFVVVTVVGEGLYHSVQFPAGPAIAGWVTARVNQARSLASVA